MKKQIVINTGILPPKMVEVVRSFSYKLGQPNYSSVDFFCSVRQECPESEVEVTSERLHSFAKVEVQKSIASFLEAQAAKEKAERQAEADKQNSRAKRLEGKDNAKESAQLDAGKQATDDIEIVPDKQ